MPGGIAARERYRARRSLQGHAVEKSVDSYAWVSFAGPEQRSTSSSPAPPPPHLLHPLEGLERSNQTGGRDFHSVRNDVHAPVHPVGEIHLGMAGFASHRAISGRATASKIVGSTVLNLDIGLDLNDLSRELPTLLEPFHEDLSEESFR